MSALLGCVIALSPVLFASAPGGNRDQPSEGIKQAFLRYEQISAVVEIDGAGFRSFDGGNPPKGKSPTVSIIHTLDGTRYAVDMDAKAVFAQPCAGVPDARR